MSGFTIIPAIDLRDGCCVRLRQGRADESVTYSSDPVAMARHWEAEGARCLHVVDLDGSFSGAPVHTEVIASIIRAIAIPVEVGGGLRTDEHIEQALAAGAVRAIIGTRALESVDSVAELAKRFGDGLAVGIDARDGEVQVRGWVEGAGMRATELAGRMEAAGVKTLVYTDIARDGMLRGANVAAMGEMCAAVSCKVIASGGITSVDDVRALKALGRPNLMGGIVGKALYEKAVTVPDLNAAAGSEEKGDA